MLFSQRFQSFFVSSATLPALATILDVPRTLPASIPKRMARARLLAGPLAFPTFTGAVLRLALFQASCSCRSRFRAGRPIRPSGASGRLFAQVIRAIHLAGSLRGSHASFKAVASLRAATGIITEGICLSLSPGQNASS